MIAIFSALLALLFILLAGYWLSILLLPKNLESYAFLIAPFLGCGVVEFIAQNCSAVGLSTEISVWIMTGLILTVYFYLLLKNKDRLKINFWRDFSFQKIVDFFRTYKIYAFLPGLFSAFILIGPLVKLGYLTWFGGGTDGTGYIRYAYFLQKHSVHNAGQIPDISYPWYGWVHAVIQSDFLGASFFLSSLSSLFFLDPLKLFNIVMACYGFLVPVAVYLVLRVCFEQSETLSLISASLMACQNFWLLSGYATALNQMSGIPYFILLFGFIYLALKKNEITLYLLNGFLIAVLISHYPVVFAVLLPVFGLFLIKEIYYFKDFQVKKFMVGLILMILFPVMIYQTIPAIYSIFNRQKTEKISSGFLRQYLSRGFVVGQYRPSIPEIAPFSQTSKGLEVASQYFSGFFNLERTYKDWISKSVFEKRIYCLFCLLFLVLVLSSLFYVDKSIMFYYGVSLFLFASVILYPLYQKYWYGMWKVMTYVQFLSVIAICVGLLKCWKWVQPMPKIKLAFSLILIFFSVHNITRAVEMIHRPFHYCDKSILDLELVQNQIAAKLSENEALQIEFKDGDDVSDYEWLSIAYMLKKTKLIIPENSPAFKMFFYSDYQTHNLKPRFSLIKKGKEYFVEEII